MAEIRAGDVRAVPLNDHCWQLQVLTVAKSDTKEHGAGQEYWHGIERYPSTVRDAALQVFELAAKRSDADDLAALAEAVRRAREDIVASVEAIGEVAR